MLATLPIPATYEAVIRPTVFQVVKQLVTERLLPLTDRIVFTDQIEQEGFRFNGKEDCPDGVFYMKDSYLKVTIQKTFKEVPNGLQVNYKDYPKIFLDRARNISMTTIYSPVTVEFSIEVYTPSLAGLRNYKSTVRHIMSSGREVGSHDISYHYTLPETTWQWLYDLHRLTSDGSTLMEWVKGHLSNNSDVITTGTHHELAIMDRQLDMVGLMTDYPGNIEKNSEEGVYRLSVGYSLNFALPDNIGYGYPIMVDQQTLPNKYLPTPEPIDPYFYYSTDMDAIDLDFAKRKTVIRIPPEDTERLTTYPTAYCPIVTVLVSIDSEDELECFNLAELGDVTLDRLLLKGIMESNSTDKMHIPYKTPFLITLHNHNHLVREDEIRIDPGLNVHFRTPKNKTGIYRVSLCYLGQPHRLPRKELRKVINVDYYYALYMKLLMWGCRKDSIPAYAYNFIETLWNGCGLDYFEGIIEPYRKDEGNVNRPPYIRVGDSYYSTNKTVQTTFVNVKKGER